MRKFHLIYLAGAALCTAAVNAQSSEGFVGSVMDPRPEPHSVLPPITDGERNAVINEQIQRSSKRQAAIAACSEATAADARIQNLAKSNGQALFGKMTGMDRTIRGYSISGVLVVRPDIGFRCSVKNGSVTQLSFRGL